MDELVSRINESYQQINERMALLTNPVLERLESYGVEVARKMISEGMINEMKDMLTTSNSLLEIVRAHPTSELKTANDVDSWYAIFMNVAGQNMKLEVTIKVYEAYLHNNPQ